MTTGQSKKEKSFATYFKNNKEPFIRGFAVGFLVCLFITEVIGLHIFS